MMDIEFFYKKRPQQKYQICAISIIQLNIYKTAILNTSCLHYYYKYMRLILLGVFKKGYETNV